MYLATGTFDFQKLASLGSDGTLARALQDNLQWTGLTARHLSLLVFVGVFLGFAVKTPLVPFHGWLPLTYSEAPVSTTMLLTGLMSKMGVYGFLRILLPLFPEELRALQVPLLSLAVLSIVFSAGAAFAQQDLRRLFGFSSINHLGYCLLGIFAVAGTGAGQSPGVYREAALSGVILQMFNHGLTAATLFWFTGLLEERTNGSSYLGDFGGIRQRAPIFCGLMGIALFSSLGLPGLNGFIGEFLIFRGVFPLAPWAAGFAVLGLLITAVVLLTLTQRVFHGPLNSARSGLLDLTLRERLCLAPALLLMLVLGVWPQLLLGPISSTVINMISWTE
jgi:NADH-quinone oxidoreductase subunit M